MWPLKQEGIVPQRIAFSWKISPNTGVLKVADVSATVSFAPKVFTAKK